MVNNILYVCNNDSAVGPSNLQYWASFKWLAVLNYVTWALMQNTSAISLGCTTCNVPVDLVIVLDVQA